MARESKSRAIRCHRHTYKSGYATTGALRVSYFKMLAVSLEKTGMLEWDDIHSCFIVSNRGTVCLKGSRPGGDQERPHPTTGHAGASGAKEKET